MKEFTVGLLVGAVAVGLFAPKSNVLQAMGPSMAKAADVAGRQGCSRQQEADNKNLVASIKPGSGSLYELMTPDYLQHNPEYVRFAELNGVSGRKTVEAMDKFRLGVTGSRLGPRAPGQPATKLSYMMLAECDIVVQVNESWHPVPGTPGQFYASYFFNMWRLKDGKLAEHWDPDGIPDPLPEYLTVPIDQLNKVDPAGTAAER